MIRWATIQDVERVWELKQALQLSESLLDASMVHAPEDRLRDYGYFLLSFADQTSWYALYEQDEELLGYARVSFGPLIGPSDPKTFRVDGVFVRPSHRKTRVLPALYRFVETELPALGYDRVQGYTLVSNQSVIDLWMKRGARIKAVILEKSYGGQSPGETGEGRQERSQGSDRDPARSPGPGAGGSALPGDPVDRRGDRTEPRDVRP